MDWDCSDGPLGERGHGTCVDWTYSDGPLCERGHGTWVDGTYTGWSACRERFIIGFFVSVVVSLVTWMISGKRF